MNGQGTVLVTGGSGFLGGWCIVEALRQGYSVRTTVRDPSHARTRSARGVATADRRRRAPSGARSADLMSDEGWPEAVAGCDYVLHVASPFPREAAEGPRRADRAGARGRAAGAAREPRRGREEDRDDLLGRGRPQRQRRRARRPSRADRGGLERPHGPAHVAVREVEETRRASGVGAGARTRRRGAARDDPAGGDHRAAARARPLVLAAGDRAAARRTDARGCRGSASRSSTYATSPRFTSRR